MPDASRRRRGRNRASVAVGFAAFVATLVVFAIGRPAPVALCEQASHAAGEISLDRSVFVSDVSFASETPEDIVSSNITFVNALFGEHFCEEEIARDALRSYYV